MAVTLHKFVSPILIVIGAIFCGVSIGTQYWFSQSAKEPEFGTFVHYGLWRNCSSTDKITLCDTIPATPLLQATRTTVCSSFLMTAFTLVLAIISIFKNRNYSYSIIAALSALAQSGQMVLGLALFLKDMQKENDDHGGVSWSFGVGWAGVFFNISGMIGFLIEACVRDDYERMK